MKIRMKAKFRHFSANTIVEVPEDLAQNLVREGFAEIIKEDPKKINRSETIETAVQEPNETAAKTTTNKKKK